MKARQQTGRSTLLGQLVQDSFRIVVVVVQSSLWWRKLDVMVSKLKLQQILRLKIVRAEKPRVIKPMALFVENKIQIKNN
jgi:nuclear transport factor 2 (NTF2) superfamily protein